MPAASRGTDGSNPVPSRGESANHRFLGGGARGFLSPFHHRARLIYCGASGAAEWLSACRSSTASSTRSPSKLGRHRRHTPLVVEIVGGHRSRQANSDIFAWRCGVARRPIRENATFERYPSYAPAAALVGRCRGLQRIQGWGALSDQDIGEACRLARQALEAERDDANRSSSRSKLTNQLS